jgi:peptidoglycan hydrolase-like protein with peptidoglycan-binding domain
MNLYLKKTLKVDNDYDATLAANVKTFQKAVGIHSKQDKLDLQHLEKWLTG